MALQKIRTASSGVTGGYWQIASTLYVKDTHLTHVDMRCYLNADIRAAGIANYLPLEGFLYHFVFSGELSVAQCYAGIKATALADGVLWFADAVDC